jgi:hypothetical protein
MGFAAGAGAVAAAVLLATGAMAQERLDPTVGRRVAQNDETAQVQSRIEQMSSQRDDVVSKVKLESVRLERLEAYNRQTKALIDDQEREKQSLNRQVEGIVFVQRGVYPLMEEMITYLRKFVQLDVPFLIDERTRRLDRLDALLGRADVTVAEKYRQVTEAYQIEDEYGRTISAYDATLDDSDPEFAGRNVTFLQFGRIILVYKTADGSRMARWDQKERRWIELDSGYRDAVNRGIRIARKQTSPELLSLPISGAVEVEGAR